MKVEVTHAMTYGMISPMFWFLNHALLYWTMAILQHSHSTRFGRGMICLLNSSFLQQKQTPAKAHNEKKKVKGTYQENPKMGWLNCLKVLY